jgi:hypothetical protein
MALTFSMNLSCVSLHGTITQVFGENDGGLSFLYSRRALIQNPKISRLANTAATPISNNRI